MHLRDELNLLHVALADLRKLVEEIAAKVEARSAKAMPKKVTKG